MVVISFFIEIKSVEDTKKRFIYQDITLANCQTSASCGKQYYKPEYPSHSIPASGMIRILVYAGILEQKWFVEPFVRNPDSFYRGSLTISS